MDRLRIENGWVNATGGFGASGIGTGYAHDYGNSTLGSVEIQNGTFFATGGAYGAGIGTGDSDIFGRSTIDNLVIAGGVFEIQGGTHGAGIGAGRAQNFGTSGVDSVVLESGSFDIRGGSDAAGIGAGVADAGSTASVRTIAIRGGSAVANRSGTVHITDGFENAAIGSGSSGGMIPQTHITGSALSLHGDPGIGPVSSLVLTGAVFVNCISQSAHCVAAHALALVNASLTATTNTATFVARGASTECTEDASVFVEYSVRSDRESFGDLRALHFGQLPPCVHANCSLRIAHWLGSSADVAYSGQTVGLFRSVPWVGNYRVDIGGVGYCQASGGPDLLVFEGETFTEELVICGGTPTATASRDRLIILVLVIAIGAAVPIAVLIVVVVIVLRRRRGLKNAPISVDTQQSYILDSGTESRILV
jgi:hypothetical protein